MSRRAAAAKHSAPAPADVEVAEIPDGPVRLTSPRGTRVVVDREVALRLVRRGYTLPD